MGLHRRDEIAGPADWPSRFAGIGSAEDGREMDRKRNALHAEGMGKFFACSGMVVLRSAAIIGPLDKTCAGSDGPRRASCRISEDHQ